MPKPRKPKIINTPSYVGPDRRFGLDRRGRIDRRKVQRQAVGGFFEKEYGANLGGAGDWLPLRAKVPEQRSGRERRSEKDRRQK